MCGDFDRDDRVIAEGVSDHGCWHVEIGVLSRFLLPCIKPVTSSMRTKLTIDGERLRDDSPQLLSPGRHVFYPINDTSPRIRRGIQFPESSY